jgi:hypothetical protein
MRWKNQTNILNRKEEILFIFLEILVIYFIRLNCEKYNKLWWNRL